MSLSLLTSWAMRALSAVKCQPKLRISMRMARSTLSPTAMKSTRKSIFSCVRRMKEANLLRSTMVQFCMTMLLVRRELMRA